jgi:mono/diheme cytochrome c family protein
MITFMLRRCSSIALAFAFAFRAISASSVSPSDAEFFENNIRPLLAEHCYECHGAASEKVKGGLRLNTRAGLLKGGEGGPVVVPGHPESSPLIASVKGPVGDHPQMPAKKPALAPPAVAALEEWIRRGAPDPRDEPASEPPKGVHWAFKPVAAPPAPSLQNPPGVVRNAVDLFLQERMAARGVAPLPQADKRTLLRRATFDLTGLPPTPAEMEGFENDRSPEAFARVVDRLLDSPRYGERWARHWLDVARYADSKGYVFEQERRFSHSFTYRDWVVNSLNNDLPYDQFIIQQIAGDKVATAENPWPMAGQGFLTLGRRFLDNNTDIIDDRLDVIFRGVQGLTIGCARCHDHKFDPIPSADYYSLYGVFDSSEEPAEKPLLAANPDGVAAREFADERAKRQKELDDFRAQRTAEMLELQRDRFGDYLLTATEARGWEWSPLETLARSRTLDPGLAAAWRDRLEAWFKADDARFSPWFALAKLGTNDFAKAAEGLLAAGFSSVKPQPNSAVVDALRRSPPKSLADAAKIYGNLVSSASRSWTNLLAEARAKHQPEPRELPDPALESLRQVVDAPDSALMSVKNDIDRFFDTPTAQKLRALKRKMDELEATHPGAPWRAMALIDKPNPSEPVVFKRGNPGNPGPKVPRQLPELLAGRSRAPFKIGSGRLELAQALVSRDNPLAARVMVNRVWLWHFGAPLVRTPSDFGLRSDPPSHPELLDHLAAWFMDHGWSLKALHRHLMTSAAYQQAADGGSNPSIGALFDKNTKTDPGNTLYWRMNRQRLDFEELRDSLLAVTGELNGRMGGHPVEMFDETQSLRRSLYGFIDRQNLPGLLRAFDFASPDSSAPMRFQTTSPQQALFILNSPFMAERAEAFVRRGNEFGDRSPETRVRGMYRLAFQRDPDPGELARAVAFIAASPGLPPVPATAASWSYGSGRFNPATQRVEQWRPFARFTGDAWQWEEKLPSKDGKWTMLNRHGGHPGHSAADSAIRRWTAPYDAEVAIAGRLKHPGEQGDGVLGRIICSRSGQLGEWDAFHADKETKVERVKVRRGDTLDFVVEPKADENTDGFDWSPEITVLGVAAPDDPSPRVWNASRDFGGATAPPPPLPNWAQFAQAILASNEFVFVD